MDVKKVGNIPDGGGWKAHGRSMGSTAVQKKAQIGFDYIHSLVDDHSRLAYSEVLPDEKGATCSAFLLRAADYFAGHGITRIERVMTDNHFSYKHVSRHRRRDDFLEGQTRVHPAALPLAERQSRALQPDPAGRMGLPAGLHQQHRTHPRPGAVAGVLQHSKTPLSHRRTAPDQPTVMTVPAEYT